MKKTSPDKKKATRKKTASKTAQKSSASKKATPAKTVTTAKNTKPASAAKKKRPAQVIIKRKSNGVDAGSTKNEKKIIKKLSAKQLREFQQLLIEMRDQFSGQVSSLRGDSLRRFDEVNTNEDGTDAFERQFALSLASTEQDVIYEIDEALRRIQSRTYGICEVSGDAIEIERLKAIPFTRHSLSAQAEIESKQGQLRQSVVRRGLM